MNNYELPIVDQDLLNVLFRGNILKLSFAYNFFLTIYNVYVGEFCNDENEIFDINYTRKEYEIAKKNIKIYHYTFPKPWEKWNEQKWFWDQYDAESRTHRIKILEKMWWKNALNTPIFAPELSALKDNLKENKKMSFAYRVQEKIDMLESKLRAKARKRDKIYISLFIILFILFIASLLFRF